MAIRIKSSEPRKRRIMDLMKARADARKVTDIQEITPGLFEGRAWDRNRETGRGAWTYLGPIRVTSAELLCAYGRRWAEP